MKMSYSLYKGKPKEQKVNSYDLGLAYSTDYNLLQQRVSLFAGLI